MPKWLFVVIVFILTLPAVYALLKPGYYNMHDDMQMIRQLEMEKCLHDGQVPCRWTPDLGFGYGYPLFNFYPPLPYLVGQFYRTFGFSFVNTVKLTAVTQIVSASLAMFLLAASLFGPLGGFLAALFYTYAPYHAVNIYVRGAMNEAWAAVFFPLIFYFSRRLIIKPNLNNSVWLSLALAGLFLSHLPMTITFAPFAVLWCLFWLNRHRSTKALINLVISGLISLGITAYFVLPVALESSLVQIESMFQNYYHYTVHFTSFSQLFISRFWGEGPSVWGQADQMSFQIGYLHWLIPLALLVYAVFKRSAKLILAAFIALLGFFAAFLTHQRSVFIWQLFPIIQKIQFPWRFLNHSVFFLSLSIGILPLIFKSQRLKILFSILSLILLFILNLSYFHPLTSGPITDQQKFSGQAWQNQITSGIYDYLPKTASRAATAPAKDFLDAIDPADLNYQITGAKKGTDWIFFNIDLPRSAQITLPLLAFPHFEVKNHGQTIDYQVEPDLGRITLDLPAGQHQLYAKLRNTPIRYLSNSISFITLLFLASFFFNLSWKKLTKSKK